LIFPLWCIGKIFAAVSLKRRGFPAALHCVTPSYIQRDSTPWGCSIARVVVFPSHRFSLATPLVAMLLNRALRSSGFFCHVIFKQRMIGHDNVSNR